MTNLFPRKRIGQHFLNDAALAERIVLASGVTHGDWVVEIGPGLGALTRPLLTHTGRVLAIELDERLPEHLMRVTAGLGELRVERGDALRVDYRELAARLGGPLQIVANLPYYLSSQLLLHFLEQGDAIARMTLMFQDEVAQRIAARPGTKAYGTLSVLCGVWLASEILFTIPPTAFHPPPKVMSAVIRLTRRAQPLVPVEDPALFSRVVHAAFGQRRKVLSNALKVLDPAPAAWLQRAGIDPERRGETLSIAEFAGLTRAIQQESTA
ncbi:MAG: 16S rRNA (adenine(1518)-N(6)/adenine(1519)-N(6))-dimethyltransferase RsmA [Magnetococcales bacterium]|nr:16S rRNA (adenine(1518)-N(6)/adenine(1519)-N(6))-dimethyltransferase RsmA [Magnetococcales bacterium]